MSTRVSSKQLSSTVKEIGRGLFFILTIGLAACTNPAEIGRRQDSPTVSLKLTDEDAIDRYSCRWYQDNNNMWILVCAPLNGGGTSGHISSRL